MSERQPIDDAYFNVIRAYEPLQDKEVRGLMAIIRDSASESERKEAFDKLVLHNQRFVISVAKKWRRGDNFLDLVNEGNIGLMKAIANFDPNKGVRFATYAVHWINQAVRNYITMKEPIVHPSNANRIFHYCRNIRSAFYNENQRNPTIDELYEQIEEKFDYKITDKRDLLEFQQFSIDVDDEENTASVDVKDEIMERLSVANDCIANADSEHAKKAVSTVMSFLTEQERNVIGMCFGVDGHEMMSTKETALALSLSEQRVRQLKETGMARMRSALENNNKKLTNGKQNED